MTWSYSGDPSSSDKDAVRFLSGDTVESTKFSVSDEEIAYVLVDYPGVNMAAAVVADSLAAKCSRYADSSAGDASLSASQFATNFRATAADLRAKAASMVLPFFGGRSRAGKDALAEDTDAVQPAFLIGMDDRPGTPSSPSDPTEDC